MFAAPLAAACDTNGILQALCAGLTENELIFFIQLETFLFHC